MANINEMELELIKLVQEGNPSQKDHALTALMMRYSDFIWRRVTQYRGRPYYEDEKFDLLNEARIGFQRAVELFDSTKEASLTTYSRYWVDNELRNYTRKKTQPISLSADMYRKFATAKRMQDEGMSQHEIALALDISTETLRELFDAKQSMVSITGNLSFDIDAPLESILPSEEKSAEENAALDENIEHLNRWVDSLEDEAMRLAVCMKYGIKGQSQDHSFQSIADTLTSMGVDEKRWNKQGANDLVMKALEIFRLRGRQDARDLRLNAEGFDESGLRDEGFDEPGLQDVSMFANSQNDEGVIEPATKRQRVDNEASRLDKK